MAHVKPTRSCKVRSTGSQVPLPLVASAAAAGIFGTEQHGWRPRWWGETWATHAAGAGGIGLAWAVCLHGSGGAGGLASPVAAAKGAHTALVGGEGAYTVHMRLMEGGSCWLHGRGVMCYRVLGACMACGPHGMVPHDVKPVAQDCCCMWPSTALKLKEKR